MCGIIGYNGKNNAADMLLEGLEKLEYRGYDSAGIAVMQNGGVQLRRQKGKVAGLKKLLQQAPLTAGTIGIGHTRWATHGIPSKSNCHPHQAGMVTLVHNGIIENYKELKQQMEAYGYVFRSDTDSEAAAACLDHCYQKTRSPIAAMAKAYGMLRGSFAFAILFADHPDTLFAMRLHSPLLIGIGEQEAFLGSDIHAFLAHTRRYITLQHREFAQIGKNEISVYDQQGTLIPKQEKLSSASIADMQKEGFAHFMLKEIYEEPKVLRAVLPSLFSQDFQELCFSLREYEELHIVGCGSAMYAGMAAKYLFEQIAHIRCDCMCASEYRYYPPVYRGKTLVIFISQSGETADTLAALRNTKRRGIPTLAIVNVPGSALAIEADKLIYTKAKTEISVATTKAYCAQLCVLSVLALQLALARQTLSSAEAERIKKEFFQLPKLIEELLHAPIYAEIAKKLRFAQHLFFLGRGLDYALCLEGSLKLKEVSYIHSEAYPAGELKHGTISLIEKGTFIIALMSSAELSEKMLGNIKEVKARGARVFLCCRDTLHISEDDYEAVLPLPAVSSFLQGIVTIVPLQMIAYLCAKERGCEIDQPRNLAKSVTVE